MAKLNKEELKSVIYRIGDEGIDYTFIHYSDFSDIKDEEFHSLRRAYIKAVKDMKAYLTTLAEENDVDIDDYNF